MNAKLNNAVSLVKLQLNGRKSKIVVAITAFAVVALAILATAQINGAVLHTFDKQSTGAVLYTFDKQSTGAVLHTFDKQSTGAVLHTFDIQIGVPIPITH